MAFSPSSPKHAEDETPAAPRDQSRDRRLTDWRLSGAPLGSSPTRGPQGEATAAGGGLHMAIHRLRALALGAAAFLASCAATTAAPDPEGERMAAPDPNRVYELRIYQAAPGKLAALVARFRDHTADLFAKHGMTNVAYWTPLDPADERIIYLLSYPSLEASEASKAAFLADPEWAAVQAETEADGPLVASLSFSFLQLTDYSPHLELEPPIAERVFELRTYTAAPGRLADLHARFRDHTLDLFAKHGMENVLYFELMAGQERSDDTLVYVLAYSSAEARNASFQAFLADPAWRAVAAASEANGPIIAQGGVEGVLMDTTDFSTLR
jgi:uncharacterized protein YbaA (DUF1428 family)